MASECWFIRPSSYEQWRSELGYRMGMWHMVELGWANLGSIVSQVWAANDEMVEPSIPTNASPAQAP